MKIATHALDSKSGNTPVPQQHPDPTKRSAFARSAVTSIFSPFGLGNAWQWADFIDRTPAEIAVIREQVEQDQLRAAI